MVNLSASNAALVRDVVEALGAPAVLLDGQGVAQALSPAMQALIPGLAAGKLLALVLRDPDLNDAIEQVAIEGGAKTIELIERVPVERTFRIHIAALRDSGLRHATLLTFQDLSEQRVIERMRVDFVANASHELRTPLASLLGFVETLQGPARERQVALVLKTPREALQVPGDRDELLRLMENLVENAIKYGKPGGEVAVTVDAGESEASFSVRDDGPGIAPEHLPRLTERFYRVDTAASREAGGTGLGLAIVKHIVLRHRGRLTIESKSGEGATFRAILPRFEAGRTNG